MNKPTQDRRAFLLRLAGLTAAQLLPVSALLAAAESEGERRGFLLGEHEGEHLVHFRDQGDIFIKGGSATGSSQLAFGTQQVKRGTGIPIHRHFQMDEMFYVLAGGGTLMLDEIPHTFERGGTIFIPKNSWHGFKNPDDELLLLWVVTPAGLDGFFRETCTPPGVPPKHLSKEQIREIAKKYATEFR